MRRGGAGRPLWVGALLLAACGWPAGLPEAAAPGVMPGGEAYPDLMRPARAPMGGELDAALIVAVEDYRALGRRDGARAMGAAWYRYLREERGLAPYRITLLRDAEATQRAIVRALERARWRARNGTLWLVIIGHVGSERPPEYGELWLAGGDGTQATRERHAQAIAPLLGRAGYGRHARLVAVLDGCLPAKSGSAGDVGSSGTWTPQTPGFRGRREEVGSTRPGRRRGAPSDVAIFSAGLGPGCVETLPGAQFPALSYLLLGGLRGWADHDGNGNVTAVEGLRYAALLLRAGSVGTPRPQPSLYGADITLARRVSGSGPRAAQVRAPGVAAVSEAALLREPLAWSRDPMVTIERGSFAMGCPSREDGDCERDEKPTYQVKLSRFQIDPLEVTQADYRRCVEAGACSPVEVQRCFVWTGEAFSRGAALPEPLTRDEHPVVCVSWSQAENYCNVVGKRLPTEAQWERAAVGTSQRRFPWGAGEPTCAQAQFDGCGEHTRPVGMRPRGATPEGVQDLAGNVSEWVYDWYDRKAYRRPWREDPVGAEVGQVRVVRGGSYYDGATVLRSSYRYGLNPSSSFSTVGFRCAR